MTNASWETRVNGVDEAIAPDRPAARHLNLFRDVQHPGELTHHVLLRDIAAPTFPWAVRELHRRLYEGTPAGNAQNQSIALRRGFPVRWSASLGALGWFLMTILLVTGSDLGRGFQLLDGGGSMAQSAAPVVLFPVLEALAPWLFGCAVLLLGISLLMSMCSRRQFFLVAQQNDENSFDLWVSGMSWRCDAQFDREFANFVASIRLHQRATLDVPQTSNQGP